MSEKILIPTFVEAEPFEKLEFGGIEKALQKCYTAKCDPVFMPQLVDARIIAPKDSPVWQWYTTPSVRATGRTEQGNAVVVYAHVPNYFSKPANVAKAVSQNLVRGAGRMPQKEFQKLLRLEDNKDVFVVDYNKLRNSTSGVIDVTQALEHPQVIPFLGGHARAEQYLQKYREVKGNEIGVWHFNDYLSDDGPCGRVLFLGSNCNYALNGNLNLSNNGRFLGVRRGANGVSIAPGRQARKNQDLDREL